MKLNFCGHMVDSNYLNQQNKTYCDHTMIGNCCIEGFANGQQLLQQQQQQNIENFQQQSTLDNNVGSDSNVTNNNNNSNDNYNINFEENFQHTPNSISSPYPTNSFGIGFDNFSCFPKSTSPQETFQLKILRQDSSPTFTTERGEKFMLPGTDIIGKKHELFLQQ